MIGTIVAHTIRVQIRSGALPVTAVVITLLLGTAGFAAWRHQEQLQAERSRYNEAVRSQWLEQPDRHPHRVAHYGYMAFRERMPLSFFDSGVESYAGTAIYLEAHRQNPANFSEAGQSAVLMRLGELTPALVLQLIVPLVIFFLGFATVSGEREAGTWAMMLAQGVPLRSILLGKALGLMAIVGLLVAPGMAAVAVLSLRTALPGAELPRVAMLVGSYATYLAICGLAAVLVSSRKTSSRAALATLILVWVFACVVMPRALQAGGTARWPLPSRAAFDAQLERDLEDAGDSHNPDDPHFVQLRKRILAEYGVATVEDLPFNYSAYVMKEGEALTSQAFERRYRELVETFRRQGAPLEAGAWINPFLAVRRLSMALAGSDMRHYIAFQQQAEAFRFSMIQRLNDLHLTEIKQRNDRDQRVSRERWEEFPAFTYRPPSLAEVVQEHAAALVSLALWVLVLAVSVAFLRPVVS